MAEATAKKRNPLLMDVPPGETIIRMSREFDYPRQLVWDVYTDGDAMRHWWGPSKYDTVVREHDFRNGGKWRIDNATPDGKEVHPFYGVFSCIKPIDEFTWTFGYADFPPGTETYRFLDLGGRTRIEAISVFPDVASRDAIAAGGMEKGARETYERLDVLLAKVGHSKGVKSTESNPKVQFTRTVKAPRELVFEVWTRAEHLEHWFSPNGYTVHGVQSDPRPGGIFKLIMRNADGNGFWSVGKYLEVDPPRRVVTRVGGEAPGGSLMFEVVNTATFEEQGGRTIIHASGEVIAMHDRTIAETAIAGMHEGWKQTLDRFEAELARTQKARAKGAHS
jgi:uncharacterized protein YndB with AHSA1/START domain